MKTALSLLLALGICFAQTGQNPNDGVQKTASGDISVVVEGYGQNPQEAMMSAKRAAVEKGIGTFIQSETEVKNFMVNKDVILTRTMGAVKSVTTLSESTGPDGAVTVKIQAVVSAAGIHDNLAALRVLLESMEKPRVMVLIRESNVGNDVPTNAAAETEIIRYLTEKEFSVIDPATVDQLKQQEQTIQAMEGNAAAAAAIGAQAGAEMIITGTAISRAEDMSQQLGGMKSCQADVAIKVIICATAKIVTAKTQHAASVHISPESGGTQAIGKAAQKIMDEYVFEKIISSWQDIVNNGISLKVMVSNVKVYKAATAVIEGIKNATGNVITITKRNWNQGSGLLELDVKYKGNSDGFCELIDGFVLNQNYKISVSGNTSNSVRLTIGQ
jgi:hypothetical protein